MAVREGLLEELPAERGPSMREGCILLPCLRLAEATSRVF